MLTEFDSGAALVTLDYPLPAGWSAAKIVLRFIMPNGYPVAPPDGFWVETELDHRRQEQPRSTEASPQIPEAGMSRQRFSWHFDAGHWSANPDNLLTWLRSCQERLEKLE